MGRPTILLLVLATACTRFTTPVAPDLREAACVTLTPYGDLGNHVSPFEIAVDSRNRRIYSTSLSNRTLAVFDADSHALLGMYPVRSTAQVRPDVIADATGPVWVLGERDPTVVRFGHEQWDRRQYAQLFDMSSAGVALEEGGVLVLGANESGEQSLQRFDANGDLGLSVQLEAHTHGVFALAGGRVALPSRDWESEGLHVFDASSLELVQRCTLPFEAFRGAQLDEGTIVVSGDTDIGTAGCDGTPAVAWAAGVENRDVIAVGDLAVVLDRVGSGEGADPNLGLARLVNRGGVLSDLTFPTAKNTGFGALDTTTGLLWVNSEGSSELVAYDPTSGQERARLRTGTFIDGLAVDPQAEHGYVVTGRLSNTLLRLEHGQISAQTDTVRWPFSPVFDPGRDLVWVLSQTESTVHGLGRADLEPARVIDPALGSNTLLSFGSLLLHPKRDTLFLAHSQLDLVVELDPVQGSELGRWELGGPAILDEEEIGHLAQLVEPGTGALLLVRSNDGRVQRLDPSTGLLSTTWLDAAELDAATGGVVVDIATVLADADLLYVGGMALDTRTLSRRAEADLPVSRLLGVHPWDREHLLGVSTDGTVLHELERDGTIVGSHPHTASEQKAQTFRLVPHQDSIVTVRSQHARMCWFGLDQLRD